VSSRFQAKFNGNPLEDFHLPKSSITYQVELEWVMAAHYDNMSLDEFTQMDGAYQSHIVAAYRTENRIQSVLMEDSRIKGELERAAMEARSQAEQRSGIR
jgi:hypothetical protein